jgi:hypothetical protein
MTSLDWRKARSRRDVEDKRGSGVVLPNGGVTTHVPRDELARRAQSEMRRWARRLKPADRDRFLPRAT